VLEEWDEIKFGDEDDRSKPSKCFFLFSISAVDLKKLSDIHRRSADIQDARMKEFREAIGRKGQKRFLNIFEEGFHGQFYLNLKESLKILRI
jgi:hypothetical protein